MGKECSTCRYWKQSDIDVTRGVCIHPRRQDYKGQYYYGYIKDNDYCQLHEVKDDSKNTIEQV